MKMSKMLMPTLREVPAEAEIKSHQLMLRAGLMRKAAAGVYSYLPMGLKVLKNVENIIRKAMDESGAQEVLMRYSACRNIYGFRQMGTLRTGDVSSERQKRP